MVKKVFTLLFLLLAAAFAFAQTTQSGYAKTKGRYDSKGNLIPGTRIGGVSIQLTGGHSTVADANGDFTLTAPDRKFYLSNVQKQGYVLTDPDVLKKQYTCSSNPLVISMETKEKQADDQLAAERRLWNQLQKQLEQREKELESLKAINKITEEEFRQAIQELYDNQASNESLISDMAKRYAEIDYDLLDEFYRQVMFCIENGDLVKADSLLRSRGDVQHLVQEHLSKGQIIQQQEEKLQKDKMKDDAKTDDLGRLCYSYYEKFAAQFENDSAAYYLELRANLDTTNVEWQLDAGLFMDKYMADYDKALAYYQRALRHALSKNGENHHDVLASYNNIGLVHAYQGEFTQAIAYHQKALAIQKSIYGEIHPEVAISYNNIGFAYSYRANPGDYERALEYFQKSLNIFESLYGEINSDVALGYNNIGFVYSNIGKETLALENYQKALVIRKKLYGENHHNVAAIYHNIGTTYAYQGNFSNAIEYLQKALTIFKSVYGERHPKVALSYHNIASVYNAQDDYSHALEYFQKSLSIRKEVYGEVHRDVAASYNSIGKVFIYQKDYEPALEYFEKALNILQTLYERPQPDMVISYNGIGTVYSNLGDYPLAMENFHTALNIAKLIYGGENHPFVAANYNGIGGVYDKQGNYTQALEYYLKALDINISIYGDSHPDTKNTANKIELLQKKMMAQKPAAMKQYVFTITFGESDGQNLSGEYVVLQYDNWSIDSNKSLYDIRNETKGKTATIMIMKDEVISQHTFENGIGGTIDLKQVGKKEKAHIIRLYHNYKQ